MNIFRNTSHVWLFHNVEHVLFREIHFQNTGPRANCTQGHVEVDFRNFQCDKAAIMANSPTVQLTHLDNRCKLRRRSRRVRQTCAVELTFVRRYWKWSTWQLTWGQVCDSTCRRDDFNFGEMTIRPVGTSAIWPAIPVWQWRNRLIAGPCITSTPGCLSRLFHRWFCKNNDDHLA